MNTRLLIKISSVGSGLFSSIRNGKTPIERYDNNEKMTSTLVARPLSTALNKTDKIAIRATAVTELTTRKKIGSETPMYNKESRDRKGIIIVGHGANPSTVHDGGLT